MTLKSALQDFKDTTLAAVSGLLGKLAYLASLRRPNGGYAHWGMETVHGHQASEKALKAAHTEVVTSVLRTRLPLLVNDLEDSSRSSGLAPEAYVENMREHLDEVMPDGKEDSPAATHLSSVLLALSKLERHRERATQ